MIKLRKNSEVYQLPTHANELTLRNYMALQEWTKGEADSAGLVSALSGLAYDDCLSIAGKWERHMNFTSIVGSLKSFPALDAPKKFEVSGKQLERRPFGSMLTGQRIALMDLARANEVTDCLDRVLAICLAPQVYKSQWASNISLMQEEVLNMPAEVAVPLVYFFLGSGIATKSSGVWLSLHLMLSMSRQKMADFKSSVFGLY